MITTIILNVNGFNANSIKSFKSVECAKEFYRNNDESRTKNESSLICFESDHELSFVEIEIEYDNQNYISIDFDSKKGSL